MGEVEKEEYKVSGLMKDLYVLKIEERDLKEKYGEGYEEMRVRLWGGGVGEKVKGKGKGWVDKMIKEEKWVCGIEVKVEERGY